MMVSLMGKLLPQPDSRLGGVNRHTSLRNFSGDLTASGEEDDLAFERVAGTRFIPEHSYFSIRIVEMRLAEWSNYVASFLPMCSCFVRYPYGDTKREVPFIVGYDMIRNELGKDAPKSGGQRVEFNNIYIVENAPVKAGAVEMYVALCRIADSSFTRGMLDLLADAVGMVGGPAAGIIARTGTGLTNRLMTILGADGVDTRFGMFNGSALTKSGYRVFAGANSNKLKVDELQMKRGQLFHQPSGAIAPTTIDDIDYLVVGFEYQKSLVNENFEATSHPAFSEGWQKILQKLGDHDKLGAENALNQLFLKIAASPDLVAADRLAVVMAYSDLFKDWKRELMPEKTDVLRGSSGPNLSTRLKNAANSKGGMNAHVSGILESTSDWLTSSDLARKGKPAAEATSVALAKTARAFRQKIDKAATKLQRDNAPGDLLDQVTAKFVGVALSGEI
jgi:hypothetical protein